MKGGTEQTMKFEQVYKVGSEWHCNSRFDSRLEHLNDGILWP